MDFDSALSPCEAGDAEDWFIEEPHNHQAEVDRVEQLCRTQCPLAKQVECARKALTNGENWGTWAGVTLPGISPCKKRAQAAAKERLRLIAGLEQCYRDDCVKWFIVTEHTEQSLAEARDAELDLPHKQLLLCPQCQAAEQELISNLADQTPVSITPTVEAAVSTGDSELAYYWNLRQGAILTDRDSRPDWFLIDPEGAIEGRYAWPVAARNFGRTRDRLLNMLTAGWTVREATSADRDWNRPRPRAVGASHASARRPGDLAHRRTERRGATTSPRRHDVLLTGHSA